jgi:hypothetical protein
MKKTIATILLGWYVMTFQGQKAAGPYTTESDCALVAWQLSIQFPNQILLQCREYR